MLILSQGQIALLETPSLVREASDRGWLARISLFDRNEALVTAIRGAFPGIDASCTDLVWGDPVPVNEAAIAFVDPPWYMEYTVAFLWAAARRTRIGGRVLLSMPAEGTRPNTVK